MGPTEKGGDVEFGGRRLKDLVELGLCEGDHSNVGNNYLNSSHLLGVEGGVRLGHQQGLVVLVHFGQVDALAVQVLADLVPPDREVLLQAAAQVGAVWRRLRYDFVEELIWSLPVGGLHRQKGGDRECDGQSQKPAVRGGPNNGAHKRVGEKVASQEVCDGLARKFLHLRVVELLHFEDLEFSKVVVLQ